LEPAPPPATTRYSTAEGGIRFGGGVIVRATPDPIEIPLNEIAILFYSFYY
jgi:hypothetical protein